MMTDTTTRSVAHASFTLTRDFPVAVERVFQAFADPEQKAAWFGDSIDWDSTEQVYDFRVGGREVAEGRFHNGPVSRFEAVYTDIVDNERIVLSYDMWIDGRHISTSAAAYEFETVDGGTRYTHTEHGIHLDGDSGAAREEGTRAILDTLEAHLTR